MKDDSADSKSGEVRRGADDALGREHVLTEWTPVGEGRHIADAEAAGGRDHRGQRIRRTEWAHRNPPNRSCERKPEPRRDGEGDKSAEQVAIADEDEIANAADET